MNKLSSKSIFMLWAISVIIILNGLIYYQSKKATDNVAFAVKDNQETSQNSYGYPILSYEEFSKHNSSGNCWLVINDKIYNVTNYLKIHPGGGETITPFCGQDTTKVFADKPHSKSAYDLLTPYYIGNIGQKIEQKNSESVSILDMLLQLLTGKKAEGSGSENPPLLQQNNNGLASDPNMPVSAGNNTSSKSPSSPPVSTESQPVSSTSPTSTLRPNSLKTIPSYTAAQVAVHNTASNCWMIVNNKIYNVSGFLNKHSGGASTMTPYCGKDATAIFVGKPHPGSDINALTPYYIGDLKNIRITPIPTPTVTPVITPNPTTTPTLTPMPSPNPASSPTPTPNPNPASAVYTAAQVAVHNTASNCWMIVNNSVYNVTSYLPYHPGGTGAILPYCGKNGTSAFLGLPHSQNANTILASYFVGILGNGVTPAPVPTITPNPTISPALTPSSSPTPAPNQSPSPTPSATPAQEKTYIINITESGLFDMQSLAINRGDTIRFQYTPPIDDEITIRFTPNPPSSMKLDHDNASRSFTFSQTGTWTFKSQSDQETITVK